VGGGLQPGAALVVVRLAVVGRGRHDRRNGDRRRQILWQAR
jgi:hypothetical protein